MSEGMKKIEEALANADADHEEVLTQIARALVILLDLKDTREINGVVMTPDGLYRLHFRKEL